MSNFIQETLKEWNLSEYIERFKDEKIDEEAFLYMPESMIKELIPTIGQRFCFITNRNKLLQNANDISFNNCLVSDISNVNESNDNIYSVISFTNDSLNNYNSTNDLSTDECHGKVLRELLSQSGSGKQLLSQTRLSSSDRNKICHIIIEKLLSNSMKITAEEFKKWATEIVSLFQYEKTSMYYVPSHAKLKRLANGKLWDKYNNLKKFIKKRKQVEKENTELSRYYQDLLITLRAIQPEDSNLENLWRETFSARNRGTSVANYYEEYPILKTAIGVKLLQIDFEIETGIDTLIYQRKWPEIAPYILLLAQKRNVCTSLCKLANDIPTETLSFLILPYLFRSTNVKTGNKKRWKPSALELAESFIFQVSSIANLESKLQKRKEKLEEFGLTLQPMVVVVGTLVNITSYYVFVNDVKYTLTSLMNAVNLCFQAFFALDATYPADSEVVWHFLQRHVYGITNEKYVRNFVSVDTTWHDLQELILSK